MRSRWGGAVGKTLALGTWAVAGLVLFACSTTTTGTGGTGDDGDDDDTQDGGSHTGLDSGPSQLDARTTADAPYADADASTGGDDDDGGACQPGAVTDNYTFHQPVTPVGACPLEDLDKYIEACGTGAAAGDCTTFRQSEDATCLACLETPITAATWGAVVYDNNSSIVFANFSGCDYTVNSASSTATQSCDQSSQFLRLCEHDACDANCNGLPAADESTCQDTADTGVCSTYQGQVNDCENVADTPGDACTGATFDQEVLAVGKILCVDTR